MSFFPSQQELIETLNGQSEEKALDAVNKISNVNFLTSQGMLPLHLACQKPWKKVVQAILDKKGPNSFKNRDGLTALHIAQNNGYFENAVCLVKHNPNLCLIGDRQGRTPLHEAAKKESLFSFLDYYLALEDIDLNVIDKHKSTPLHEAAKSGNLNAIQMLVAKKADPDLYDKQGYKPSHYLKIAIKDEKNPYKAEEINQALALLTPVPSLFSLASHKVFELYPTREKLDELEGLITGVFYPALEEVMKSYKNAETLQQIVNERKIAEQRAEEQQQLQEMDILERLKKLGM